MTLSDSSLNIRDLWITRVTRSASDLIFDFSALQCDRTGANCAIRQFVGTVPPDVTLVHTPDSAWSVRRVVLEPGANDLTAAFPGSAETPWPALGLRAEASSVLTSYWEAGQPTLPKIGHAFERMLYLSSITITTVGYGDVVPTTFVARVLVASEALLGIVVAGLFLNTIAHSVSRRPGAPDGDDPTDA